jgi:ribonuclease P protein component
MRREYRLRRGADFERVRTNRRSWAHPLLVCSLARSPGSGPTRVGLIVGRRIGNAVTRNRVKRRMREVIRSLHPQLRPGFDLVFIARPPSVSASVGELEAAIASLLRRADTLAPLRGAAPDGAQAATSE